MYLPCSCYCCPSVFNPPIKAISGEHESIKVLRYDVPIYALHQKIETPDQGWLIEFRRDLYFP